MLFFAPFYLSAYIRCVVRLITSPIASRQERYSFLLSYYHDPVRVTSSRFRRVYKIIRLPLVFPPRPCSPTSS